MRESAVEAILNFRTIDLYFRDTFCKMSQGLASQKVWKDAQEIRGVADAEISEIHSWAMKIRPGWERDVLREATQVVDKLQMDQQKQMEMLQRQENQAMQQVHAQRMAEKRKIDAVKAEKQQKEAVVLAERQAKQDEKKAKEAAVEAEAELLRDEEAKTLKKKTAGKKN